MTSQCPWRHLSRTVSICFGSCDKYKVFKVCCLIMQSCHWSPALFWGRWISLLAGLPMKLLNWLQAVINATARLVCYSRKAEHITLVLKDLQSCIGCTVHIRERINYKLCVIVFKCHIWSQDSIRDLPVHQHSLLLGDRAFPAAAAMAQNCLPSTVSPSLLLQLCLHSTKPSKPIYLA